MANRKISDLTSLTAPATGDLLPIVDISEAAAADKNKKITYAELLASAPAGSAAAPSFSFDADPDTGLFNPAADTLAFAEGGVESMRIDSSGRVGIGTSSPGSALEVSASVPVITVNSGAANASSIEFKQAGTLYGRVRFDGNNFDIGNLYSGGATIINAGNAERARIDSSGRLLVGTATANTSGAKLQTVDGLTFPATAVASADPNTLDDYEEGTFTPSIGGDATYTSRSGTYIKVGRKVSIAGTFVINTKGTGSAAIVSGLPFAASALTPIYVGIFQNLAINVVFLLGSIPATTSRVDFTSIAAAAGTTPNETSVIGNGTRIDYAATYFV
jgi:hypothetical protein